MSPADNLMIKIPDSLQIAQIFWNQINLVTIKAAFSATTLQGEEAPADGLNEGQKCQKCFDEHEKHIIDHYFYLQKNLRPEK